MNNVQKFLELADDLGNNEYPLLYVDLTRTTSGEWQAALKKSISVNEWLAYGDGNCSPEGACSAALEDYERRQPKVLDWKDIPDGVLVFRKGCSHFMYHEANENGDTKNLRLSDRWQYWGGNGECPLPNYVDYRVVTRNGAVTGKGKWVHSTYDSDIIGYRIIGLKDGYKYPDEK